jgi:hypothetical protein
MRSWRLRSYFLRKAFPHPQTKFFYRWSDKGYKKRRVVLTGIMIDRGLVVQGKEGRIKWRRTLGGVLFDILPAGFYISKEKKIFGPVPDTR